QCHVTSGWLDRRVHPGPGGAWVECPERVSWRRHGEKSSLAARIHARHARCSPSRRARRWNLTPRTVASVVGLVVMPLAACTAFDGLSAKRAPATSKGQDAGASVDDGTGEEPSAREAGAPDGGAAVATYLAEDDAARACAKTLECPNLAASIAYSI